MIKACNYLNDIIFKQEDIIIIIIIIVPIFLFLVVDITFISSEVLKSYPCKFHLIEDPLANSSGE